MQKVLAVRGLHFTQTNPADDAPLSFRSMPRFDDRWLGKVANE
jgi:hypothetical protein